MSVQARRHVGGYSLRKLGVASALVVFVLHATAFGQDAEDTWDFAVRMLGSGDRESAIKRVRQRLKDGNDPDGDLARLLAYLPTAPRQDKEYRTLIGVLTKLGGEAADRRLLEECSKTLQDLDVSKGSLLDAHILENRALISLRLGRFEAGLRAAERMHTIASSIGWRRGQANALLLQFKMFAYLKRYEDLEVAAGKLSLLQEQRGRPYDMHAARIDRCFAMIELGRLVKVRSKLENSLDAAIQHRGKAQWWRIEAGAHDGLAVALRELEDYSTALDHAEQAESIWEARGKKGEGGLINSRLSQSVLLMEVGDFDAAERLLKQVEQALGSGSSQERCDLRGNLGYVAGRRGDYARAQKLLQSARDGFERLDDKARVATACRDLSQVLIDAGSPAKALPLLSQALELCGDDPVAAADTLALRAEARLLSGTLDEADKDLATARKIKDAAVLPRIRNRLHELSGRLQLARGNFAESAAEFRKAIEGIEGAFAGLSDEQTFRARAQRARVYQGALASAFEGKQAETMVEFLERSRAAALLEALGTRSSVLAVGLEPGLVVELAAAKAAVVEARRKYQATLRMNSRSKVDTARKVLDAAEAEMLALSNKAVRARKAPLDTVRPEPATLKQLQAALKPHEVVVYYSLHGDEGCALLVTPKDARPVDLAATRSILTACEAARAAYTGGRAEPASTRKELQRLLVAPLKLEKGMASVMVCPDGELAFVPWPEVLGEQYGSTLPSGTLLTLLRARTKDLKPGGGVLAFGDPTYTVEEAAATRGAGLASLAQSRAEVETIIGFARTTSIGLLGKDATEENVRKHIGADVSTRRHWRAVHFACHGVIDPRFPRRTALALTPTRDDDGSLQLPEIMALRVDADLVALSACDSGRGRLVRGEGVVGLTRAFLATGAPRVLASLWRVDDKATSRLMIAFYRHWLGKEHTPPAEALRRAQAEVRKDFAHPKYWAAWVVWGLPD